MSERIRLVEGDVDVVWTFQVKEDGSAVDLSSATVVLYVTDDDAAEGTNRVNGASCTPDGDQVTNKGVCTYVFTSTNCTITSGDTVRGKYRIKTTISGIERWRDEGDFVLEKNRHIVSA